VTTFLFVYFVIVTILMYVCFKKQSKNKTLKRRYSMANITRSKGNIYNLAKLAKERLKQNNYIKSKGNVINNASSFAEYITKHKKCQISSQKVQTKLSYDEELYKKVCALIENKNTVNPVSYLIDKELFANLDTEAKQFYIHNLTEKYKFMRNRYFKEHPVSLYV